MRLAIKRTLAFCLYSLLIPTSSAADKSPFSLEDLTNTRHVMSVAMAPNAKRVAFTASVPRRVYTDPDGSEWRDLYVMDRKGKQTKVMLGAAAIVSPQWQEDSRHLWFLARTVDTPQASLYKAKVGNKPNLQFTHDFHIVGYHASFDEKQIVFWSPTPPGKQDQRLIELGFNANVFEESAPVNRLFTLKNTNFKKAKQLKFEGHVTNARVSPDAKYIAVTHSPTPAVDDVVMRKQVSVLNIDGEKLYDIPHKGKLLAVRWSPDGRYLALNGSNDVSSPAPGELFVFDTKLKSLSKVEAGIMGFIEDMAWRNNQEIMLAVSEGTGSNIYSVNVTTSEAEVTFPPNGVIYTKLSSDKKGNKLALIGHHPTHPRELYWQRSEEPERATQSNAWISNRTLGVQSAITHRARDGLELEAVYVAPIVKQDTPPPAIFFVHGGPEAHVSNGWLERYIHPAHYAASLGFASVFPNYRGSTGRGIEFTKLGQGDYAGAEFNDLLDLIDHLTEQGLIDKSRMAITGASYGGYASAWAATKWSPLFKAAVSTMGVGNQLSKFGTTDIPTEMVYQHAMQWPWQDWMWLLERSPVYYANNAQTPLLILHGEEDTRVHVSQSIELYRHLKLRGQAPVRLVTYPNAAHGFKRPSARLDYAMRMMRWIETFTLSDTAQMPPMEVDHVKRIPVVRKQSRKAP